MKELIDIQSRLRAAKSQRNDFGKYNYRSCEDILEAVKPLLKENDCTLVIWDDVVEVGGRIYVKAFAKIRKILKNIYCTMVHLMPMEIFISGLLIIKF